MDRDSVVGGSYKVDSNNKQLNIQSGSVAVGRDCDDANIHTTHEVVQESCDIAMDGSESDVSEMSDLSGLSEDAWRPIAGPISWVQRQMVMGRDPRDVLRDLTDAEIPEDLGDFALWKIIINVVWEPPRRKKLPQYNTLSDAIDLIQRCRKILVLTGAGVSVSCGIPDFRSRDGIYARLAQDFPDLPDPQSMFDINYFAYDPRPFFKFAREIYPGQFEPSKCHKFIRLIETHGQLLRNYTQNIDTLEQVAGIQRVIQCHGSFATASCQNCHKKVDCQSIRADIFNQVIPRCPSCPPDTPNNIMKPDIVFFGESLSDEFHNQMAEDKDACDLLIVIGSSLKVRPVALIPNYIPNGVPQILINRESLRHMTFDIELLGDCDVILNELCRRLPAEWSVLCDDHPGMTQITEDVVSRRAVEMRKAGAAVGEIVTPRDCLSPEETRRKQAGKQSRIRDDVDLKKSNVKRASCVGHTNDREIVNSDLSLKQNSSINCKLLDSSKSTADISDMEETVVDTVEEFNRGRECLLDKMCDNTDDRKEPEEYEMIMREPNVEPKESGDTTVNEDCVERKISASNCVNGRILHDIDSGDGDSAPVISHVARYMERETTQDTRVEPPRASNVTRVSSTQAQSSVVSSSVQSPHTQDGSQTSRVSRSHENRNERSDEVKPTSSWSSEVKGCSRISGSKSRLRSFDVAEGSEDRTARLDVDTDPLAVAHDAQVSTTQPDVKLPDKHERPTRSPPKKDKKRKLSSERHKHSRDHGKRVRIDELNKNDPRSSSSDVTTPNNHVYPTPDQAYITHYIYGTEFLYLPPSRYVFLGAEFSMDDNRSVTPENTSRPLSPQSPSDIEVTSTKSYQNDKDAQVWGCDRIKSSSVNNSEGQASGCDHKESSLANN